MSEYSSWKPLSMLEQMHNGWRNSSYLWGKQNLLLKVKLRPFLLVLYFQTWWHLTKASSSYKAICTENEIVSSQCMTENTRGIKWCDPALFTKCLWIAVTEPRLLEKAGSEPQEQLVCLWPSERGPVNRINSIPWHLFCDPAEVWRCV